MMSDLDVTQNIDHVNSSLFSSMERTGVLIKVVIKVDDQLFNFAQKYLEYLKSLMNANKPIDFIQAALVTQTLSSVFAKKVDVLHEQIHAFTIVFRKLELGQNQDENIESSQNGDHPERARIAKKKSERDSGVHVFENVCNVNNIRKSCIKKWSDKDIKKVDPYSIRNKIGECPKMKTKDTFSCYIYDNKLDKLGKKEEFGCNGILCDNLIPKDNFCLPCPHSQNISKFNDTMNATAFGADVVLPDPLPDVFDDGNNVDHDGGPTSPAPPAHELSYHDVVEEFLNNSLDNREDSISGHVYFERINKVQEMLVDVGGIYNILWSPINDESKQIEKKIKIRNVKNTSEEVKKECDKTLKSEYPSEYVLSDLMLAIFKLKSNVPLHPHFTNSLKTEKEFRNKHISKKSAKRPKTLAPNPRNADFKGFNEFGEDNMDNNSFENELDIEPAHISDHEDNADPNENCMQEALQHIREYQQGLHQTQHDDSINEIAVKVSAWHDSIRPHLEREEGRTNFDIHEYGSKILHTFPDNNAKSTISFAECVRNQPREEIPRYFLSSLLLANSYNVDVSKNNPEDLRINDMMLTLLSRVRQHEILDEGMRKEFS